MKHVEAAMETLNQAGSFQRCGLGTVLWKETDGPRRNVCTSVGSFTCSFAETHVPRARGMRGAQLHLLPHNSSWAC